MRRPPATFAGHASRHDRRRQVLQGIAEALRCPVAALIEAAPFDHFPDDTAELVRLWFRIESPTARRSLLERVRALAFNG